MWNFECKEQNRSSNKETNENKAANSNHEGLGKKATAAAHITNVAYYQTHPIHVLVKSSRLSLKTFEEQLMKQSSVRNNFSKLNNFKKYGSGCTRSGITRFLFTLCLYITSWTLPDFQCNMMIQ